MILRDFLRWYVTARMPFVARALYGRELRAWGVFCIGLGTVEGGVVGVLVKNVFAGAVEPLVLNQCVALVAGAPAFANILSFAWASYASGRDKVRIVTMLETAAALSLFAVAFAPIDGAGLAMFVGGVILARIFWSGVVTVRAAVWRANYPRHVRGDFTARVTTVAALTMAAAGILTGLALDYDDRAFRVVYPLAGLAMLAGMYVYRGVRVRGDRQLRRAELGQDGESAERQPGYRQILRENPDYRHYLTCMMAFGGGNLMMVGQLVVVLNEQLDVSRLEQMLITSSIPFLAIPLSMPFWGRFFDRTNVVSYRAKQSWLFVAALSMFLAGGVTASLPLFFAGSALLGIGFAGGRISWNLGHNDFAPDRHATRYMGLHVTLTGIRGLTMPVIGIGFYEWVKLAYPGAGGYALALPLLLTFSGACGFVWLDRRIRRRDGAAESSDTEAVDGL